MEARCSTALQLAKSQGHAECVEALSEAAAAAEGRAGAGGASSGAAVADAPLLGQRVVLGGLLSRPELNAERAIGRDPAVFVASRAPFRPG